MAKKKTSKPALSIVPDVVADVVDPLAEPEADHRPDVYQEGKLWIIRSSRIGACIKALIAAGRGYEEGRYESTQAMLDNAAAEGTLHEPAIIKALENDGFEVVTRQEEVELVIIPGKLIVRGHTDGRLRDIAANTPGIKTWEFGTEAKTMSKDRFAKWLKTNETWVGFETYAWQVSVYMHATGLPFIYVVKDRNSGKLDIRHLDHPPIPMDEIKDRGIEILAGIKKHEKTGEFPPCSTDDSGDRWFCPVPYLHDDEIGDEPENDDYDPFASASEALLMNAADQYLGLSETVKAGAEADKERREVKKRILDLTNFRKDEFDQKGSSGRKTVKVGRYTITRVDSKSRSKTTDWKKVAAHLDMSTEELETLIEDNSKEGPMSHSIRVKKGS